MAQAQFARTFLSQMNPDRLPARSPDPSDGAGLTIVEWIDVSLAMGELSLLPGVRKPGPDANVVAAAPLFGTRSQTAPSAAPCMWWRFSPEPFTLRRAGEKPHHGEAGMNVANPVETLNRPALAVEVTERLRRLIEEEHKLRSLAAALQEVD